MKLLFVVNDADFFLSHRLPLGIAARAAGYDVHVAAPERGGHRRLAEYGLSFHPLRLARASADPRSELVTLHALYRLYRRLRPDLVHHVTVKPVLYGTLAARAAGVPRVVNAVSGLGYVFIQPGLRARLRRRLVEQGYRLSLRHERQRVIFQNPDDLRLFVQRGLVPKEQAVLIRGSGVDVERFRPSPEPEGAPVVMFPSRMLWDKGLREFVAAAELLQRRGVRARFVLVGDSDPGNPACASPDWLRARADRAVVEWWGHRADMPETLARATLVCLPSYREGLPKVLLEAAASGRPIVATDVPGCREITRQGSNGLLVPARRVEPLAQAIAELLTDAERRRAMGRAGRELVLREFSEEHVVRETLKLYTEF